MQLFSRHLACGSLLLSLVIAAAETKAQKTYIKLQLSYPLAGMPRLIKNTMEETGYNSTATLGYTQHFPKSSHYPVVALEAGKFIRDKISISILAGIEEAGKVSGYNTYRGGIDINFINWVFHPKFNYHPKGAILGLGPSALLVNYKAPKPKFSDYHHSKILPGLGITAATDSKKTEGFRMTVFAAFNLHPTFDAETLFFTTNNTSYSFQTEINPTNLQLGFFFRF